MSPQDRLRELFSASTADAAAVDHGSFRLVRGPAREVLTIATSRLTMRLPEASDLAAIVRINDHEEVARNTAQPLPYTIDDALRFVVAIRDELAAGTGLFLLIEEAATREVVGVGQLFAITSHNQAMLGYRLEPCHHGKGYATEAARALTDFGFAVLLLERVYALCFAGNDASRHVLEKVGMAFEGRQAHSHLTLSGYVDSLWFGITRDVWLDGHGRQGQLRDVSKVGG